MGRQRRLADTRNQYKGGLALPDMTWILLGCVSLIALVTDMRNQRIPNWLTLPAIAAGFVWQGWMWGTEGIALSAIGLASGFIPFFICYLFGALGAGDVKLFAAIGSITGGIFVLHAAIYSVLFAGLIGVGIYMRRKQLLHKVWLLVLEVYLVLAGKGLAGYSRKGPSPADGMLRFPFMYAVAPALLALLLEHLHGWGGFL